MRVTPINRALRLPRLNQGVSSGALGLIWGGGGFLSFIIGSSYGWLMAIPFVVVTMVIHSVFRWFFKQDHRFFDINSRYAKLADEYQPDPREKLPKFFERPEKWCKGVRI